MNPFTSPLLTRCWGATRSTPDVAFCVARKNSKDELFELRGEVSLSIASGVEGSKFLVAAAKWRVMPDRGIATPDRLALDNKTVHDSRACNAHEPGISTAAAGWGGCLGNKLPFHKLLPRQGLGYDYGPVNTHAARCLPMPAPHC